MTRLRLRLFRALLVELVAALCGGTASYAS